MQPSATQGTDVRDRILEEATHLFAARGYDGTSLQDIAGAVGVRKPSLLYHFRSKEELRRSVLEEMLARWNDVLPNVLLAATTGKDRFDGVIGEMTSFFTADPERARLLLREALDRPGEVAALAKAHLRRWVEAICDFIRAGQEEGRIHTAVDPEAYVAHVICLVVASVATVDSMGVLVSPRARRRVSERQIRELVRLTKSALFRTREEPLAGV